MNNPSATNVRPDSDVAPNANKPLSVACDHGNECSVDTSPLCLGLQAAGSITRNTQSQKSPNTSARQSRSSRPGENTALEAGAVLSDDDYTKVRISQADDMS